MCALTGVWIYERELAAIFTTQTAGEALNYHPHLHGLLADGCWKDGVCTRISQADLKAIEQVFAERVLAQLHKPERITNEVVAHILPQDHRVFSVRIGDPFHDQESEHFVARYIERAPLSLEHSPSKTASSSTRPKTEQHTRSMLWSFLLNYLRRCRCSTSLSLDSTEGTPAGAEVRAPSSLLIPKQS